MNQNQQYGYPMQGIQQGAGYQQPYPTYAYPSPYGQYGQNGVQPPQMLPQQQQQGVAQNIPGMLPLEQSYVENILRLN
ncbi:spore coat protein GerQ, partial [Metabacillus halosaccharovorans]